MNSYFHFKQFKIEQDKCAMKVSTDACIQGAWVPVAPSVNRILDIGTGTGLLALMLAQRTASASIDAVELDTDASQQAIQNAESSPWHNRINVIRGDIKEYTVDILYDFIICNPPFFHNSLQGDDIARNRVRHTDTLRYDELLDAIDKLLGYDGSACILLPFEEHKTWAELLHNKGWHIVSELHIQPNAQKKANRVVSVCRRVHKARQFEHLQIYAQPQQYTVEFTNLLRPYYLNL